MKKKSAMSSILLGAGAATAVLGVLKSTGVINKLIYKKEYEVVSRYVEKHYPGSSFSDFNKTDRGFITVITTPEKCNIVLFLTKTETGSYVFSETYSEN